MNQLNVYRLIYNRGILITYHYKNNFKCITLNNIKICEEFLNYTLPHNEEFSISPVTFPQLN